MGCNSSTAAQTPGKSNGASKQNSGAGAPAGVMGQSKLSFHETYEKKEKLGKGQYAEVFRAIHKTTKAVVAVKFIDKKALTPEDLAALEVEVKAMEILTGHPNFVRLYDFFAEKDFFYVCMELISGGELFDRIVQKEKYTEREAREIFKQTTAAIAFAHSKGVVHRDLKPENILLKSPDDDTSIKIADLGFARLIPTTPGAGSAAIMKTPCGTPGYVAPEILSGNPYSSKVDIWSLGVIFYILLCGYPPFISDNDDQQELFGLIKAARFTFDPADWAGISDGVKDLIRHILVADPAQRYTAKQILDHPWMRLDASAVPDVALGATVAQLKRFNARRRLKGAMATVRSTVRMKLIMGARSSLSAVNNGTAGSPLTAALAAARASKAAAKDTDREDETREATAAGTSV